MRRKLAKNLKEVQQSKEFLDLVSKISKNKFFKRPIRVDIDGTENIYSHSMNSSPTLNPSPSPSPAQILM